jgi:hypothetical protein
MSYSSQFIQNFDFSYNEDLDLDDVKTSEDEEGKTEIK